MISTVQHHFPPPFSPRNSESKAFPGAHTGAQRIRASEVETIAGGPQYAVHHLRAMPAADHDPGAELHSPTRARRHSLQNAQLKARDNRRRNSEVKTDEKTGSAGAVRRRISRACDQCNQLRTKCDGRGPCAHCVGGWDLSVRVETRLTCAQSSASRANTFGNAKNGAKRRGRIWRSSKPRPPRRPRTRPRPAAIRPTIPPPIGPLTEATSASKAKAPRRGTCPRPRSRCKRRACRTAQAGDRP